MIIALLIAILLVLCFLLFFVLSAMYEIREKLKNIETRSNHVYLQTLLWLRGHYENIEEFEKAKILNDTINKLGL